MDSGARGECLVRSREGWLYRGEAGVWGRTGGQRCLMPFATNVFVNCPFDSQYRPLLRALLFTILDLGFEPRLALERLNSGETRIVKILELIEDAKFGVHDLSRIQAEAVGEFYRLNMPFEL